MPGHFKLPSVRGAGALVLLAGLLLVPGCPGTEAAHGSARVVGGASAQLTGAALRSVNGTYGAACRARSGGWSLALAGGASLDSLPLSVLAGDVSCALTLTALRTASSLLAATPPILLGVSFQGTPSVLGGAPDTYLNARLTSDQFAGDFGLELLYSADPSLASGDNTAKITPPTVVTHAPASGALAVSIATRLRVTFSAPMDPATLTALTFTLVQGLVSVPASVAYDTGTGLATLTPASALEPGQVYQARVSVGAQDIRHTPLAADFVWGFQTAACSQAMVPLGQAGQFAVLGASTVTNTGATAITGDLGVSPGTAITGFPPGTVTGALYSAPDAAATGGASDLGTAYAAAAARALCPVDLSGDLSGLILGPGLYRSASSLALTAGNLTLDAGGETDAVFVFQMGSTLIVDSTRALILVNGASPGNVFWQVGSSATLGTGSAFSGTILADQSITLQTGAALNGRALARVGAVTLDTNAVTRPAP